MSPTDEKDLLPKTLCPIAKVLKSHGADGELILGFRRHAPEDLNIEEPVFLYFDGLPVPFFIDSCTFKGDRAYVRLSGMDSLEAAEENCGKEVYVAYISAEEEASGLSALLGRTVLDASGAVLGRITAFEDIPGNPCLEIAAADGPLLVPFHEDFVLSSDEERKILVMDLPAGL